MPVSSSESLPRSQKRGPTWTKRMLRLHPDRVNPGSLWAPPTPQRAVARLLDRQCFGTVRSLSAAAFVRKSIDL